MYSLYRFDLYNFDFTISDIFLSLLITWDLIWYVSTTYIFISPKIILLTESDKTALRTECYFEKNIHPV